MTTTTMIKLALLILLLLAACVMDVRERRIPNRLTMAGLGAGLLMGVIVEGGFPVAALAGAGLGLALSFPLFALGAIGGGDAKLFMAVGAFLGPLALLDAGLYGAVAGGVLALGSALWHAELGRVLAGMRDLVLHFVTLGRRGRRPTLATAGSDAEAIPYGVAISAGALAAWFLPSIVGGLR